MNRLVNLLKEIPSTVKYKFELEKLVSEHSDLKSKVSVLEAELLAANEKVRELEKQLSEKQHIELLEINAKNQGF